MYVLQLSDAQNDLALKNVCGCSPQSAQFISLLNQAQRRLAIRGDFYGMVQTCCMVYQGCQIAWPRYFSTILGARSCNDIVDVKNDWYSFTGAWRGNYRQQGFSDLGGGFGRHGFTSNKVLQDNGRAPIFQNITGGGNGQIIRYYVSHTNDNGKTITLYGNQFGNYPLQEKDASGNWVNGLTLTAAPPYAATSVNVTNIQSIVRQPTQGQAYLYEYDVASNTERLLAIFEPNDTHPMFRRSIILGQNNFRNNNDSTTPKFNSLELLVKLEFIPVVDPRDFLLVDNLDALRFMISAIKAEDANDNPTAETFILKAIRELNFADRNKWPDKSIPVVVNSTNSNRVITSPI